MMNNYNAVREHIIKVIREELIGPSTKLTLSTFEDAYDIPFKERPLSRYGAAILFPQKLITDTLSGLSVEDSVNDTESDQKDYDISSDANEIKDVTEQVPENDNEIGLANEYLPSAMGISALLDTNSDLIVRVSGAYYIENKDTGSSDGVNRSWQRMPFDVSINITSNELLKYKTVRKDIVTGEANPHLELHVHIRDHSLEYISKDYKIITFTLINTKKAGQSKPKDQDCYFQCTFSINGKNGNKPFYSYPENLFRETLSEEEEEMALLYRHKKVFAVGHGCSADWECVDGDSQSGSIMTKIIPEYEVCTIEASESDKLNLDMWMLGTEKKDIVISECRKLADEYKIWIEKITEETSNIVDNRFHMAALRNIERCRKCLDRIYNGLDLLKTNNNAFISFQYMNKAMLMQHCHYSLSTDPSKVRRWKDEILQGRFEEPDYSSTNRKWRPFQLAFILMSIASFIDEESPEREIVDLIWFPTGGGKTEAYLGLSSFAIFYRRKINPENSGTTVIMRYTLRLLTTQQFQRASSLICAMEKIRRDDNNKQFGNDPITIGLWVGYSVTPNKEKQANQALDELIKGNGKNLFLIKSCPWCGAEMGVISSTKRSVVKGYKKLHSPDRVRHVCEDPDCCFSRGEGLPLQIIDEDIYKRPPTLLIGTVDKFAMMPWVSEARRLFARDSDQKYDPPCLIIQDEMHLISGPLGSMVGLYETLVDALCEKPIHNGKVIRAKVVASTATVSNAKNQIEKLFCRKNSMLFPPQGLRAGDSFFAEEKQDVQGRRYVGVFATGLPSQMTAMVRVISSLVEAPLTGGFSKEDVDPYWTSMVYFNSIRELGHACTLLRGDIREYLNVINNIRLKFPKGDERRRYINSDRELTSRIASDQISEVLNDLFKCHHKEKDALDICLATNMIQVGLDVPRISLMVIAGQPKTTAEYIQASSRAGRKYPGLIFTLLNPAKPRDRSHYEHFRAYHQSFYRYIEPTSVTPFAIPVRERALHALIVTLVRYLGDERNIDTPDHIISVELKNRIKKIILNRVNDIDNNEFDATNDQIDTIFRTWERLHATRYGDVFPMENNNNDLMMPSSYNQFEDNNRKPFPTPTSMRNVDSNCEAGIIAEYTEIL